MKLELNKKFLISTKEWFIAPDGQLYRAAWGLVTTINTDAAGKLTSVVVGKMEILGDLILTAIQADAVSGALPKLTNFKPSDGTIVTPAPLAPVGLIYFA
jgi:hypothetical protein